MACAACAGDEEASHTFSPEDCDFGKVAEKFDWSKEDEEKAGK